MTGNVARRSTLKILMAASTSVITLSREPSSYGESRRRTDEATRGSAEGIPPIGVVDLHVDIPWLVHFKRRPRSLDEGQASIAHLAEGKYVGLVFPIYLPDGPHGDASRIEDADDVYHSIESIIASNDIFRPLNARFATRGHISAFLAIEGAGAFSRDPRQIERFLARGLRLVSPCHAKNGPLASSATDVSVPYGLTSVGTELCERVYSGGALVDVSHVSDRSFSDISAIARRYGAPVVATHSNARAIARHPRNLTDEQLRTIGESGGVAGVNFHSPYVNGSNDSRTTDVIQQIEYMVGIAGLDHVAIGSDFDGGITPPRDLPNAGALPLLAAALRERGMSDGDILRVFSLNALRVLASRPSYR
jgi:membrane dipeptidase